MKRALLLAACLLSALCQLPTSSAVAAEATGEMKIGKDSIDLVKRIIHFRLTTKASSASVEVFSENGKRLHKATHDLGGAAPGKLLSVPWPDLGEDKDNFRLELEVSDAENNTFTYQLIRFFFEVPHKEVVFASGEAEIRPEEEGKLAQPLVLLQQAVAKYSKYIQVHLYVAGYTDTVGPAGENQKLSEQRAQSIAEYFAGHGLTGVPVFVRGFGESNLAVKTGDNVAEARNRRAQYIISTSPPVMPGPGAWKRVK